MQEIALIAVAVSTAVFMVMCLTTDLRERMIYVFPCYLLIPIWMMFGVASSEKAVMIGVILVLHIMAYLVFRIAGVWGDGDSDIFLLYGVVFMSFMTQIKPEYGIGLCLIAELLGMIVALLLSFLIGVVEARVKKEKLTKHSSIAVVPGFSIVIIAMVIGMIFGR